MTLSLHTGSSSLTESTGSEGDSGSDGPGLVSSAVERRVHIADVVGSTPTPATTTTFIGDVSEALAMAEFMKLGYHVCRPFSNGLPYDFITDDGERMWRVQVKTGRLRNGALYTRLGTSKYHRGRRESVTYHGRVDWIVIVWREAGRCYALRPDDANGWITLRVDASRNNQANGVRWAADYELAAALGSARVTIPPNLSPAPGRG